MYDISSKKILYSRDVIFNEQQCVTSQKEDDNNQCSEFPCPNSTDDNSCPDQNRRSKRIINEPDKYGEWVYSCVTDDPKTVKEALSRPDASKWQVAMELEMKAMSDNNVWSLEKSTNDILLSILNGFLNVKQALMVQILPIKQDWLLRVFLRSMVLITIKHLVL